MGRVKDFKELGKKGPGRKARKQGDPSMPAAVKNLKTGSVGKIKKKLGGRIRQRTKKRLLNLATATRTSKKKSRPTEQQHSTGETDSDHEDDGMYIRPHLFVMKA